MKFIDSTKETRLWNRSNTERFYNWTHTLVELMSTSELGQYWSKSCFKGVDLGPRNFSEKRILLFNEPLLHAKQLEKVTS